MIYAAAYIALVVITAGLPLGTWTRRPTTRRHNRHRRDRQLLALIHHTDRRTSR